MQNTIQTEEVNNDIKKVSTPTVKQTDKKTYDNKNTQKKTYKTQKTIKTGSATTNDNTTTTETTKKDPEITINKATITPGKVTNFSANLPSDATGKAVFKLDGKTISNPIKVTNGSVNYEYLIPSDYYYKSYTINFVYSGDKNYLSKRLNAVADIGFETNVDPTITTKNYTIKYLSNGTITANLPSDATGKVVFKLNGKTISNTIKVTNGTASYNYNASLLPRKYNLQIVYSGNVKYNAKRINTTYVTITPLDSKIVVNDVNSKAGANTTFRAALTDEYNKVVANTTIVFKINGITIGKNQTNNNGVAYLTYTLPSYYNNKNYTISVISQATRGVNSSQDTSTLKMGQLTTKITVPTINCQINDTVTVQANVIDNYKNNVLKGSVTFKLNGKTLQTVNIKDGEATYTFKPDTNIAKTFNITAIYNGNWKYASTSYNKSTLKVTKLGTITDINSYTTKTGSNISLIANVKDKNKNNINGGTVEFRIDNKKIGTAVVKNGVANLTQTLSLMPKGQYKINATYLGSDSYYSSNNSNNINIEKASVTLTATPITVQVGKYTNITIKAVDEFNKNVVNGTISFNVNGESVGKATIKNGVATLNYTPAYKFSGFTLPYTATLESNDYYNMNVAIQNVTVTSLKHVYVSNKGNDSNIGNRTHPFKTISYAIRHVATFGTVHITNGIYKTSGIGITKAVTILGEGTYKTYISGNNNTPVFTVSANSSTVNFKDLTIKNGRTNATGSAGAILSVSNLNITNVNFINNKATGNQSAGAINTNGYLNLTNTQFINNSVNYKNGQGGALRLIGNSTIIKKSKFINNTVTGTGSTSAGAIYLKNTLLSIYSSEFQGNRATGNTVLGGAISATYGQILSYSTTFKKNYVSGKEYAMGGAISSLATYLHMNNSLIESNYAKSTNYSGAGGVYIQYAGLSLNKVNFNKNYAKSTDSAFGGAIEGQYVYANIVNSRFTNNNATSTSSQVAGGAIYQKLGNITISKTAFTNNLASSKVAIGGAIYSVANATIQNSNFTSNKAKGTMLGGGAIANLGNLTVTKSNFMKNSASNVGNAITADSSAKTKITGNYWGSSSPTWSYTLRGVSKPSSYSKTKLKN